MNEALRTSCPCCAGRGRVSWLRSGVWINAHCDGRNGPCDVDSAPWVHELDNLIEKRKVRIEYKRANESIRYGQDKHFRAELESTRDDWQNLLVILIDEGQSRPSHVIRFTWRVSGREFVPAGELPYSLDTIGNLGKRIADFLWPPLEPPF